MQKKGRGVYLFIVDNKGHCDLSIIWPLGIQSLLAVSFEVSGDVVVGMSNPDWRHGECSQEDVKSDVSVKGQ